MPPLSTKLALVEAVLQYLPPDSLSLDSLGPTHGLHLLLHSLRTLWHEAGALQQGDSGPPAEGWQWQRSVFSCLSLCSSIVDLVDGMKSREAQAGNSDGYCKALCAILVGVALLLGWL